ncbi:hypothetical protein [Streptomyces spectabilis]|uniref:Uncharacterized protein n=1 Tax=Streptomyces spectabilis TaxID=68270 RepID=A0A5P2X2K1_STRST|nr:hypothetical protein [Streptomyces spectabilis]MBB5108383.1 hypothetical protein [Streptomyces spectabilis]MCI3901138.1 hypothetical protein [Streptomyces spectabilis]QEV58628.1 hypothetical protein CP982_07760 [Streptomyces spectabilis]GGV46208.1 hypothetical protein GCM10010245_72460 [Streptomyces spectabilis]
MSRLPRLRSLGRHRGKTPTQLRGELDDAYRTIAASFAEIRKLRAGTTELEAQLDQAGIDVSGALHDLRTTRTQVGQLQERVRLETQRADGLKQQLAPYLAAEANAAAVRVPPVYRDTSDPDDQATEPIQALTLQQAFGSTDPAHVPAWALKTGPAA